MNYLYPLEMKFNQSITNEDLKLLLGGKGANLNRMYHMGFPVPEGFTIIPEASNFFKDSTVDSIFSKMLWEGMVNLDKKSNKIFGDSENPLLVSVRSGSHTSMPGMMDTILNVGLNDKTVVGLANLTNEKFAWDCYRRFVSMYGNIVLGVSKELLNKCNESINNFFLECNPDTEIQKDFIKRIKKLIEIESGIPFPDNVQIQLEQAIISVFKSWHGQKAKAYREIENISEDMGTAVTVQKMVFGNLNENSATGVAFTRNPNTGENKAFGDFLINAQGEDVVDGSNITLPLNDMNKKFPTQYNTLLEYMSDLEKEFQDMCDIEFTIENGNLYILQTRVGKRTSIANDKIINDMEMEGLIDAEISKQKKQDKIIANQENDNESDWILIANGIGASPGIAIGKAVFNSTDAIISKNAGEDVILVRKITNPDDVKGISASAGVLTASGGLVSHAAVVARGWDKACVVGAEALYETINYNLYKTIDHALSYKVLFDNGEIIKINGTTGELFIKKKEL